MNMQNVNVATAHVLAFCICWNGQKKVGSQGNLIDVLCVRFLCGVNYCCSLWKTFDIKCTFHESERTHTHTRKTKTRESCRKSQKCRASKSIKMCGDRLFACIAFYRVNLNWQLSSLNANDHSNNKTIIRNGIWLRNHMCKREFDSAVAAGLTSDYVCVVLSSFNSIYESFHFSSCETQTNSVSRAILLLLYGMFIVSQSYKIFYTSQTFIWWFATYKSATWIMNSRW